MGAVILNVAIDGRPFCVACRIGKQMAGFGFRIHHAVLSLWTDGFQPTCELD